MINSNENLMTFGFDELLNARNADEEIELIEFDIQNAMQNSKEIARCRILWEKMIKFEDFRENERKNDEK